MAQYRPEHRVGGGEFAEIDRGLYREEYDAALELARSLGLRLDERSSAERRMLAPA